VIGYYQLYKAGCFGTTGGIFKFKFVFMLHSRSQNSPTLSSDIILQHYEITTIINPYLEVFGIKLDNIKNEHLSGILTYNLKEKVLDTTLLMMYSWETILV